MSHCHSRRSALKLLGACIAAAWWMPHLSLANSGTLLHKSIPGGGQLPVIGLGTWRTFNVGRVSPHGTNTAVRIHRTGAQR